MKVEVLVDGRWKGIVLEARELGPEEMVVHDEPWYEIRTPEGKKMYGPARWFRIVGEVTA